VSSLGGGWEGAVRLSVGDGLTDPGWLVQRAKPAARMALGKEPVCVTEDWQSFQAGRRVRWREAQVHDSATSGGPSRARVGRRRAWQLLLPGVGDGNARVGKIVLVACNQA